MAPIEYITINGPHNSGSVHDFLKEPEYAPSQGPIKEKIYYNVIDKPLPSSGIEISDLDNPDSSYIIKPETLPAPDLKIAARRTNQQTDTPLSLRKIIDIAIIILITGVIFAACAAGSFFFPHATPIFLGIAGASLIANAKIIDTIVNPNKREEVPDKNVEGELSLDENPNKNQIKPELILNTKTTISLDEVRNQKNSEQVIEGIPISLVVPDLKDNPKAEDRFFIVPPNDEQMAAPAQQAPNPPVAENKQPLKTKSLFRAICLSKLQDRPVSDFLENSRPSLLDSKEEDLPKAVNEVFKSLEGREEKFYDVQTTVGKAETKAEKELSEDECKELLSRYQPIITFRLA